LCLPGIALHIEGHESHSVLFRFSKFLISKFLSFCL
jgi:hypothetical protein